MTFPFELTRPRALATLLAVPVLVNYFVWSLSDFPRRQRIMSLLTRTAVVLLVVLSFAGLTWVHSVVQQYVLFLIDDRLSIGDEGRTRVDEYSEELRIKPTNEELLKEVAESSGGEFNPAPEAIFDLSGPARRPTPLWPYLLTAALLLFVADVARRRFDFSLHSPFSKMLMSAR